MGTVRLAAAHEEWPTADGEPMHGVLQLLTRDLPVRPPAFDGVELLTLFVAEDLPIDTPNGAGWCLRTYNRVDALRALEAPSWDRDPRLPKDFEPALRPFPLAFSEVTDWPGTDNLPFDLMSMWRAHTHHEEDRYQPKTGLKVGGWPFCIQSEVAWHDERGGELPDVDFVFQVDSDDKVGFVVVDSGVFYVGRRRSTGEWAATWQCC